MKYLIINADDFGMSKVFNESILDLIKEGMLKSTTVMINRVTEDQDEQIKELAELSKKKEISVGLHLEFPNSYVNFSEYIGPQHEKFLKIFGFMPSHLDIHGPSAAEWETEDITPSVAKFCREKELPCRNRGNERYYKTTATPALHGTTNDFKEIEDWIKTLEEGKYYEILFHPGNYDPNCKSSLNKGREIDNKHIKKLNSILGKYNTKSISYLDLK